MIKDVIRDIRNRHAQLHDLACQIISPHLYALKAGWRIRQKQVSGPAHAPAVISHRLDVR
jgi:hypothetical protein